MDKFEVGLVSSLSIVLILILVVGYAPFSPFSPFEGVWEPVGIREKIGSLRTHYGDNYTIQNYDWNDWFDQMHQAGGHFTEKNTWGEFTESLESHQDVTFLMLDEYRRVVWLNPPLTNQVIFFEY
ncbi:MAG: hypothetical protein PVF15_09445 [Candidatus Bathyarchaeota archaeon]